MFYILLVLITIILFTNIIIFSKLDNNEIHLEASEKEELDQLLNSNVETKTKNQAQSDYLDKTIFSNTFLAVRSY